MLGRCKSNTGCRNTQPNDTKHNDTHHNDTLYNDTQHKLIKHYHKTMVKKTRNIKTLDPYAEGHYAGCHLRCIYICEFRAQFRIKLARFVKKNFSLLNVQA